jgi:perosamine synthetase
MKRIPVAGPWITDKEVQYVADAAANAWYERANEYQTRFETEFARRLGVAHAVALPHCTAAIHLSLVALGIGPGDEVIIPEITWIATAAPVSYVGATPVFVDVDPNTWCLSAAALEKAITPRTKAVITVDLYGGMPDYDAITAITQKHGIALIEDAAQSIGASYHGKMIGSFGRTSVFSFHGSKTLTTGEGGMLATDDSQLHQRVLFLRDHGRPPGDKLFLNSEVAFKYRMSAVQAAMGLAQTERLDDLISRKRAIFGWYRDALGEIPGVRMNTEPAGTHNVYWMVTVVLDPKYGLDKNALMKGLSERGIDTRPFFAPLSSQGAYEAFAGSAGARERNPVAYAVSSHAINLPSALCLTKDQVDYVCAQFKLLLLTQSRPTQSYVDRSAKTDPSLQTR